jgi:HTH-type transcriptional regulator/antitoxin HigA
MNIRPIKNDEDLNKAFERLEIIFDSEPETKEGDELEVLSLLIEDYENKHYPIGLPDPIEAIKYRMEQMGMKQKELGEIIGFKSRASEILNKKRKLTLRMIRKINQKMQIPTDILVKEY